MIRKYLRQSIRNGYIRFYFSHSYHIPLTFILLHNSIHQFKVKQFGDKLENNHFRFFFDLDMNYVKSSIKEAYLGELGLGDLQVDVVEPLKERTFTDKDWYLNECTQIESGILASGNGWVGFMHQLV